MDDPNANISLEEHICLPWESIDPAESDPGPLPPGPVAPAPKTQAPAGLLTAPRAFGTAAALDLEKPPVLPEINAEASARQQDRASLPESEALSSNGPIGDSVRGGGWTLPLLCAGVGLIACCLIIPQADANRRLAYEKRILQMDLESIQKQVSVNDEFLTKVGNDPTLAERLAQRQMKVVRAGSRVLKLGDAASGNGSMSPFQLVNVPPPRRLPPYRPVGGVIASLCYQSRARLYLTGIALLMVAAGLVLGLGESRE